MSDYEKPSRAEDEYFARQEMEKRKHWAQERAAAMEEEQREELRRIHHMKCPKDGMDLQTIDLHGVHVDQCGFCGGIWLDAGELQQLGQAKGGLIDKVFSLFR